MQTRDFDPVTKQLMYGANLSDALSVPEYCLLVHVLDRAIKDLRDEEVGVKNSAVAWIERTSPAAFGFEEVCSYLGLSESSVRALLKENKMLPKSTGAKVLTFKAPLGGNKRVGGSVSNEENLFSESLEAFFCIQKH